MTILTHSKVTTELVRTHYNKLKYKVEHITKTTPENSLFDEKFEEDDDGSDNCSQFADEDEHLNITQADYIWQIYYERI